MIPLVAPCITEHDQRQMHNAVELGLLDHGLGEVDRYEEAFAARVGCEWAVAVNSGTSALVVALRAAVDALDYVDNGYVVDIPSWSCTAIRNAVEVGRDADAIWYVDTDWNVRRAFATWPKCQDVAIVPHMFGTDTRFNITESPVIEDWTLSLGGCVALVGEIGVCSTHASKMISTGRGGVIFGNNEGLHEQVKALVHYESHTGFGYSVAMSSMQAALGVSQLAQLDSFIERRRELAARYTEAFRPAGIECPDAECGSVFFRYLVSVESPARKVELLAERGIEAGRGVYPPLHRLAGLSDDDFPGTTAAVNSLLSVPVHPSITDSEAGHIIESVMEVCAP